MSNKEKPQNFESEKIQLGIRDPDGDKNFMVFFEADSKQKCAAYNSAIREVLRKAELSPFHQIGTTPFGENNPGYHAWEIWRPATREQLQALLPEIETRAKELMPLFEGFDEEQLEDENN